MQAPGARAQLYPLVDYILPVFPSVNCFSPQRTDSSTATPSAAFSNYLTQVTNKIKQFSLTGLVFTMQCGPQPCSLMHCLCRSGSVQKWLSALRPACVVVSALLAWWLPVAGRCIQACHAGWAPGLQACLEITIKKQAAES